MLLLPRIVLASACLLTVGVSLAWGVQSHNSDPPPPSLPPNGPASASSPPSPVPAPPATHEQAVPAGAASASRGVAPIRVEPIALEDVSVDSEGIVRVGRDGVFPIEAHPTGRYVRVHDVEVTYVNETPAAGYDVGTPRFNVLADGGFVQHREALLLHDPNNPVPPEYTSFEHPPGGSGDRAGKILVGNGQVTANSADGFEVDINPGAGSEGGVVYHDGGAHNTEGFEAAFDHAGGYVEYQAGSGGGPSISMKALMQGSLVSPARHLAAYLDRSKEFEWGNGKILLDTVSVGEVAYGGPHHGFGAYSIGHGKINYAANEGGGGDGTFSIESNTVGTVVSGPHTFGAHLGWGDGSVEYHKGGHNAGVGDSFKLHATRLAIDQGHAIASGRYAFAASLSKNGSVEYRSGESFSIVVDEHAATVVSGAHGFAAHLGDGGSASYEMADNSFKLSATYNGEVSSLRHHHFSAKLSDGGSIEHFGDKLGKFTVVAYRNGEVTYGGRAGHGGKDKEKEKKKTLQVQLTRKGDWPEEEHGGEKETGSITHDPKTGFVVEVNGPSTVTLSDAVTGEPPGGDAGGDAFSLNAIDAGVIASVGHAFVTSISDRGTVKYHPGKSFSIIVDEHAGTVVSGVHGFAAHFDDGGGASYEMADHSFELTVSCAGKVSSLRHHHFSAKLSDGGRIKHGAEVGDFTVEVTTDGEVTYGGAGEVGEDEKKNLRLQLTRVDNWRSGRGVENVDQKVRIRVATTGSITHKPEEGFVVKVNGPSTVTIGSTATGEQQQVVQFSGAGTVSFDSSGVIISKTEAVEE